MEIVFRQLGDWERQFFSIVPEGIDKVQKKVFKSHSGASKHQADLANVLYGGALLSSLSSHLLVVALLHLHFCCIFFK